MLSRTVCASIGLALLISSCAAGTRAGGVVASGHDPDFHGTPGAVQNVTGARNLIRHAVQWVSSGLADPRLLFVTCTTDGGADHRDTRSALPECGYPSFDVADHGSGSPGVLDLSTVDFEAYDVVLVASDYGGWLRQDELDILNARASEIASFLACGGGLVVLGESGDGNHLTTHDQYGFVPFALASDNWMLGPLSPTVTGDGLAMGFEANDLTRNEAHAFFTATGGMSIVDVDETGRIRTLAAWVDDIDPSITATVSRTRLWPPNHDLGNVGHVVQLTACDPDVTALVAVYSNEDDELATGDGAHSPDTNRDAAGQLRLRAERAGNGRGRVYLISTTAEVETVTVAHDCSVVGVPRDLGRESIDWLTDMMDETRQYCLTHEGQPPPGFVPVGDGPRIGPRQ